MIKLNDLTAFVLGFVAIIYAGGAMAAGSHAGGHGGDNIGQAGSAGHVDREITVDMGEMYFAHETLEFHKGETVRFIVTNVGEFVHEFNIATAAMHGNHAEEMTMMVDKGILETDVINHGLMADAGMMHDDPNSILLEPGDTAEVIWTFNGDAVIELSCNVPGHRESGMTSPILISH